MQVLLANPRGFCAGVDRAIDIVERALQLFGAPIHVRHEVVHNHHVVERLRGLGAVFVDGARPGALGRYGNFFRARGVRAQVEEEARTRHLTVFDATCPAGGQGCTWRYSANGARGCDVILIGQPGHPEIEGTMGSLRWLLRGPDPSGAETSLMLPHSRCVTPSIWRPLTRPPLSVDDTAEMVAACGQIPRLASPRRRRHLLRTPEPPGRRQEASRALRSAAGSGSRTSSNSNRLRELAERAAVPAI